MRTPARTLARTLHVLALCGALGLLAMTGCTKATPDQDPTTPVPDATFDEAQSVADATAALYRFYEVRNWCLANPTIADFTCFDSVAVDQELTGYRETLDNIQREGWHAEGDFEVLSVDVVATYFDGPIPQVKLAACVDQRSWNYYDESGQPFAQESDLPTTYQRIVWQLVNYDYPAADQWKVSYRPEGESGTC